MEFCPMNTSSSEVYSFTLARKVKRTITGWKQEVSALSSASKKSFINFGCTHFQFHTDKGLVNTEIIVWSPDTFIAR
jgi:hypothetical protein